MDNRGAHGLAVRTCAPSRGDVPPFKSMQAGTGKLEFPYCTRWGLHAPGEDIATLTVRMRAGESSAEEIRHHAEERIAADRQQWMGGRLQAI